MMRRWLGAALRGAAAGGAPPAELLRHRAQEHHPPPDRGPLPAGRQIVFDLETTGLRPTRGDAIVAIGAVALVDGRPAGRFVTLANPGRRIPVPASRHHGITDADVAGAPRAAEAVARFLEFCGGDAALLVAHNAAFDRTALHMAELRDGAPPVRAPVLCSLLASRWLDPELADHSLDAACGRHGLGPAGARRHDALSDAEAAAALWSRLLDRAALRGIASPAELARRAGMPRAMLELMGSF
jgi:DNA polymerase-3 subunit epsilon